LESIAIEAGTQSRWIAKTLGEFDNEVIVANPKQAQSISANYINNDCNDSADLKSSGKQGSQDFKAK